MFQNEPPPSRQICGPGLPRLPRASAIRLVRLSKLAQWRRIQFAKPQAAGRLRLSASIILAGPPLARFTQTIGFIGPGRMATAPQKMSTVLDDISPGVESRQLLVSIAAGVTLAKLTAGLPAGTRLVRVMPNTACLIGLGASCFSRGATASEGDAELVGQILRSVGLAFEVEESMLDAVTGLSGSGPAFVVRMIEALAEGAVAMGLSSDLALELAAQTARGAAQMVLTTGQSPVELCEQVASPGGTTLAGLEVLEAQQGPAAFRAAVEAATKRSVELGQS